MSKAKNTIKNKLKTKSPWRKPWIYTGILLGLIVLALLAYQLPPIRNRVDTLYSKLYYKFNPPSASVFSPSQQGTVEAIVKQTEAAMASIASEVPTAQVSEETPLVTDEATQTPTAETSTPYPVPASYTIAGMGLEYQTFNNCGPANVSMNLNFWGWETNQEKMRLALRTHDHDRNVMLAEMRDYVLENTDGLHAILRYGGDLQVLKALVSGGYPVLIERGHTDPQDGWMGHYSIIHAYDDSTQTVTSNDTLLSTITIPYEELMRDWRHFDGIYIVIYPADRDADVLARLGVHADESENLRLSLAEIEARIPHETGRELFFAWYSKGQILVAMGEYMSAAQAFDQAFGVYATLDMGARPWRMTWYQIGPYIAYYHSGRFQDTLALAQQTLDNSREPKALPESYYWAGMAAKAMGMSNDAHVWFEKALEYHPGWDVVLEAMADLP
ncbi:MAG TPA: hypothetical protein GXX60_08300 [Anaerolineaceae bacterium]|jgi:hypothetical protein|nr:hypothetical protein [Anaerolineaceae bacterium]